MNCRGGATEPTGLERAADYIAAQFKAAGLRPGGQDGGWFQPFGLTAGLNIDEGNSLVIRAGTESVRLTLGESYYPLAATPTSGTQQPSVDLKGVPVVFAGYGLSAPTAGYDDYAGLDVKGKAVLIFSHEPQEALRDSRLNGARPMPRDHAVQQGVRGAQPRRQSAAGRVRPQPQRRSGELRDFRDRSRSGGSPDPGPSCAPRRRWRRS